MAAIEISFAFKNNYFDFKSFGQEIKTFIDDSIFFVLETKTRKVMNVYLQKNEAELKDDMI
jgi:hypothetical protein